MDNAIEVKNLNKAYPGFQLQDVSFAVPEGTIVGLVGENGAGKSTIINLLMGAISRDSGEMRVLGCDPSARQFARIKQEIGVVLDEAYFPTVLDAKGVAYMMRTIYKNWDDARFVELLKRLELPEKKLFKDYSRGMRMKLAIAVALSHRARLLIMDEPTGGLDPIARDDILALLNDYTRDEHCTVLLSSHIVSDLEKAADLIAFLHRGRLLFCEEKDRLLEDYALLRLTRVEYEAVPREAVVSARVGKYDVEALVRREMVNAALRSEHATLEEVILFFVKGVDGK